MEDYADYDKDEVHLWASSMYVGITAIAQGLGFFFGSAIGGGIGYNQAFVILALLTWAYLFLYLLVCGAGDYD